MARCNNWPAKLALFVEEKRNQPFVWGENDCAQFASDWLAIVSGSGPAHRFFAGYNSALSAARIAQQHGGFEAIVSAELASVGFQELPVRAAQRGDIVLIDLPKKRKVMPCAVGVCVGAKAVFAGPDGIEFIPLSKCRRAWRVG